MTKQEEIREGIARIIVRELKLAMGFGVYKEGHWEKMTPKEQQSYLHIAEEIQKFEDSQGVAIKVEGELPGVEFILGLAGLKGTEYDQAIIKGIHMAMGNYKQAGYTAWEPLTEVK